MRATLFGLLFAIAAFVATPFIPVPVDDRDEQVPVAFRGLYLETRSILAGHQVDTHNISLLEASGPGILAYLAIPLLVIIGVFIAFRRTGRSLPLTIGMIALAVLVLLASSIYFLPSMIALAVASFQVRRVEMAARTAGQGAGAADEPPPDDEEEDEDFDDEDFDDEVEDDYDEDGEYEDDEEAEYEDDDADEAEDAEYEDDDEDLADDDYDEDEVDAEAELDESDDIDDESEPDEYRDDMDAELDDLEADVAAELDESEAEPDDDSDAPTRRRGRR